MSSVSVDQQRQTQAKEYARLRYRLFFVDVALSGALLLAWLGFGWAGGLQAWLLTLTTNDWLILLGVAAGLGLSLAVAELPLAFLSGHVLPHRYGLSTRSLGGWVRDHALSLSLTAALGLPLLVGVYWLLRVTGDSWWLWAALGYILFAIVLSNLAPIVIMPLFNKFIPLGEEHAELVRRLSALAERAGTRVSGVFRFDMSRRTRAANAALAGLGNTRRILLGDTLLAEFSVDEVETIIAHELGHHVHRDIPLGLAVSALATLAGMFLVAQVLNRGVAAFGLSGPADVAALPLFALTLGVFSFVTLPLGNAYSRWRERLADRYALEATSKPQAFADAFARLANQNLADADPEPWVVWLFASHPPIRERIAAAQHFTPQS
jgi:STE24 endopeptidase